MSNPFLTAYGNSWAQASDQALLGEVRRVQEENAIKSVTGHITEDDREALRILYAIQDQRRSVDPRDLARPHQIDPFDSRTREP